MEIRLTRMMDIHENLPPLFWSAVAIMLVILFGIVDYLTGQKINIVLFYLLPIVLVTWSANQSTGLVVSFMSALAWLMAEFSGIIGDSPVVYFWNTLIHAGIFFTVTYLVSELQKSHIKEQRAARTDFLTGAMNRRYFYEVLQMEIDRIHRYKHPFTVVYLDLDNFKQMNDKYGHEMGDEVLRTIASQLRSLLRRTDVIARLGGDEFAVLLPFTAQPGAEAAIRRVHAQLKEVVRKKNWPITISMGAVSYNAAPSSLEHLIDLADQVMYEVKKSTKNDAKFMIWEGEISPARAIPVVAG